MSILSWDDFDDDTPLKDAQDQSIALKAAQNIQSLDLKEAERELDEQKQAIEKRKLKNAVQNPVVTKDVELLDEQAKELAEKAKSNIQDLMRYLDEGGRVQVDDKQLFNCNSDLNQLVPFKYNWAWSLYLTSTEHHWMPAEHSLHNDARIYETLPTSAKSVFQRLQRWDTIQENAFNLKDLLNCYRLITNPECRQYILRQSFETSVANHIQKELEDAFAIRKTLIDGYTLASHRHLDADVYQDIMNTIWKHTAPLRDRMWDTQEPENLTDFLIALTIGYLVIGNLLPTYHYLTVLETAKVYNMASTQQVMLLLLRDIQTQGSFIELFMSQALLENPEVDVDRLRTTVNGVVNEVHVQLQDLLSLLAVGDNDYHLYSQVYQNIARDGLTKMGIGYDKPIKNNREVEDALSRILGQLQSLRPKVDHEVGLSGSGGSLGW